MGSCGTLGGLRVVSDETAAPPPAIEPEGPVDEREAAEITGRGLAELMYHAPFRRPLAVADVLVSGLLLLSGVLLAMRRSTAPWWVTQAVLANMLWALAQGASQLAALIGGFSKMAGWLQLQTEAQVASAGDPQLGLIDGTMRGGLVIAGFGVKLVIQLAIYGWILWRVRRADVRNILHPAR